jgi:hypothetical protein
MINDLANLSFVADLVAVEKTTTLRAEVFPIDAVTRVVRFADPPNETNVKILLDLT